MYILTHKIDILLDFDSNSKPSRLHIMDSCFFYEQLENKKPYYEKQNVIKNKTYNTHLAIIYHVVQMCVRLLLELCPIVNL